MHSVSGGIYALISALYKMDEPKLFHFRVIVPVITFWLQVTEYLTSTSLTNNEFKMVIISSSNAKPVGKGFQNWLILWSASARNFSFHSVTHNGLAFGHPFLIGWF